MISLKDELVRVRRVWDAGMGAAKWAPRRGGGAAAVTGPKGPYSRPLQGAGALRGVRPAAGRDRWRALPYTVGYCSTFCGEKESPADGKQKKNVRFCRWGERMGFLLGGDVIK